MLYDWLARTSAAGQPMGVADQAEQRALWDLESALESMLAETFQEDYAERVARARDRVRDQGA